MLVLTLYFEKNPPSHILGFEEKIDYNNNFLITKDILALLLISKKKTKQFKAQVDFIISVYPKPQRETFYAFNSFHCFVYITIHSRSEVYTKLYTGKAIPLYILHLKVLLSIYKCIL